jgi:D-glucuronyl C5-epimerase C-terminus
VRAGRVPVEEARRYRSILGAVREDLDRLPLATRGYLAIVLSRVSAHAADYDRPRALSLFEMLQANRRRLASGSLPSHPRDVVGEDGVVYRFFPAHGFQVHPLASFVRLNGLAKRGRRTETGRLAKALLARAVPTSGTLTWEYYFPYGGPPRWTSALAQGVGAQALARAGVRLDDHELLAAARRAFRAVPRSLSRSLAGGLWVREYSYSDIAILNAQLQTLVSLGEYAKLTGDPEGRAVVEDLANASRALLSRFDTGCWSLYALDGNNATPGYHSYHISLLDKLGDQTGESLWHTTAERWAAFQQASPGGVAGACA